MLALALAAGLLPRPATADGTPPAHADGHTHGPKHGPNTQVPVRHGCESFVIYNYCGDHWAWSAFPLTFRVNATGGPGGSVGAVRAAAEEWNRYWPITPPGSTLSTRCNPLCVVADASLVGGKNGINEVIFGNPVACYPASSSWIAVTCPHRAGQSGDDYHRIVEVDIFFNTASRWRVAGLDDLVVGESSAFYPGFPCNLATKNPWYDLQSAATHELGHALGPDDVQGDWPSDISDVGFTQTMAGTYFPCSTNKRTVEAGDLIAMQRAKDDSFDER